MMMKSLLLSVLALTIAFDVLAQDPIVILGRPTNRTITANIVMDRAGSVCIAYGKRSEQYSDTSAVFSAEAGVPVVVELSKLSENAMYFYRLLYRNGSTGTWSSSPQRYFRTQRARGSSFTFLIEADEHLYDKKGIRSVYQRTLDNQRRDSADFLFSLGDTFGDDHTPDLTTSDDMKDLHRDYLQYLGTTCHSMPFFFCLGNHEGESGYYLKQNAPNNIAVYGTLWRKYYYSNPVPNTFYSGNMRSEEHGVGLPENYYAFEWGDALFVVLDVYRHCDVNEKPQGWDWTLGEEQYMWLRTTLATSAARHKFVFAHHVRGQGRGAASMVSGYEWGGYEPNKNQFTFGTKRPGWEAPIHELFKRYGVNAFFQGHDHLYAKEMVDGIVYQEVPMPSDSTYEIGVLANADAYTDLTMDGSGYLRVRVDPDKAVVEYVATYLPNHETAERKNGQVRYSYTVDMRTTGVDDDPVAVVTDGAVYPQPASSTITFPMLRDGGVVELYDALGQHVTTFDLEVADVRQIPNGTYVARVRTAGSVQILPIRICHESR